MRFLPVGDEYIIVELNDLNETLLLHGQLMTTPPLGISEVIPAAQTLLIHFHSSMTNPSKLIADISKRNITGTAKQQGEIVEIPVHYNGEDLSEVADIIGISVEEVIRRHIESEYNVAFTGFAPGFAYLVNGDPIFNVPRRKSPRTRIPAGSVGLAGRFSGIYPQASPGGWQLIGVTDVPMFDLNRTPPTLLQPGMSVHFKDATKNKTTIAITQKTKHFSPKGHAIFKVKAAPMSVYFQDAGRFNVASQGVSCSGALDKSSLYEVNRLVGNHPETTVLEISLGGFSFEVLEPSVIALTGAMAPIIIETPKGNTIHSAHATAIALDKGDVVKLGYAKNGARAYLAVRGGFDTEMVLGSASRDTLANIGPEMLKLDDILYVKQQKPMASVGVDIQPIKQLPTAQDTITLDVIMGPRTDWFSAETIKLFTSQLWLVSDQSNRVGARLQGEKALTRANNNELPSEGTVPGAIQVPADGQPILFLNDRPLTGGYPVIAVIANHHLDLAGQIPVGAKIHFRAIEPFRELTANTYAHQEGNKK